MTTKHEFVDMLTRFQKNAETANNLRAKYEGSFVAVLEQKLVDSDTDYENLLTRIHNIINNQELFIGYLQMDNEYLVI